MSKNVYLPRQLRVAPDGLARILGREGMLAAGLLPQVSGGAKGYNETADILTRTIDQVPLDELYAELIATIGLLNKQRDPIIQRLTFPVVEPFEEIIQAVSEDFQEADEFGQPTGIRLGAPWNMGYDLRYFDLGIRYTFRFLGRATANQIRALHNEALEADNRLIYRTIFTRLFDNTNTSATLERSGTVVTVHPFYNGTVTALPVAPPSWKSYTFTTTHDHYLASGAAAVVSADLDTLFNTIYHHGYAQNADMILLVNKVEADRIRKFRVLSGDSYDFIPAANMPDATFRGQLVGSLPNESSEIGGLAPPEGFIGEYGFWDVIQEDMVPAGYMVGLASGGLLNPGNPVGLREHENESLRGLKLIPQFERYPLREAFYHHALGAGVRYPGAGAVMKITAGSYDVPAPIYGGPGGR